MKAVKTSNRPSPRKIIEAALFLSPRPLTYRELADLAGISPSEVDAILSEISDSLSAAGSSIVLERFANAARLYVSKDVFPYVRMLAAVPEFTPKELEVVAYIAMKGSATRADLRKITSRADSAIDKLRSLGAVVVRRRGRTVEVRKTDLFDRYFGKITR